MDLTQIHGIGPEPRFEAGGGMRNRSDGLAEREALHLVALPRARQQNLPAASYFRHALAVPPVGPQHCCELAATTVGRSDTALVDADGARLGVGFRVEVAADDAMSGRVQPPCQRLADEAETDNADGTFAIAAGST